MLSSQPIRSLFAGICCAAVLVFLSGCEGYRCGDGTVLDADTRLPLDSVFCEVLTGSEQMVTDSSGDFSLCNPFGGCMPCPDIEIEFSRAGYSSQLVTNPDHDRIILLEKE